MLRSSTTTFLLLSRPSPNDRSYPIYSGLIVVLAKGVTLVRAWTAWHPRTLLMPGRPITSKQALDIFALQTLLMPLVIVLLMALSTTIT